MVPHVTNEIQEWVERVAQLPTDGTEHTPDVCIVELGGTVGDIESMPYVEAFRQFQFRKPKNEFFLVHVSLVRGVLAGRAVLSHFLLPPVFSAPI